MIISKISLIGAGFSGLSATAYLLAEGPDMTVYEKITCRVGVSSN